MALEGLGAAVNIITLVDTSAKIASWCTQYIKDVKGAKDDILKIQREVQSLQTASESVQNLVEGPARAKLKASEKLLDALRDGRSQLNSLEERLRPPDGRKDVRRLGRQTLKWPFQSRDVESISQHLSRCREAILFTLQADQTTLLVNLDTKADRKVDRSILEKIPVAPGASFDSHTEEHNATCLPNTRVDLLREIDQWIDDSESRTIFWLNGMAGTGKSTISRTIAQSLASQNRLSANFFFKRGEAERGNMRKFFGTIASQLVVREPSIATHIRDAIDSETALFDKTLKSQFERLIFEPLSNLLQKERNHDPLVFIIDALDECDSDEDIKALIKLLSRISTIENLRARIFITSRPELPIRLGFNDIKGSFQDCVLHDMPRSVVKHDISEFLAHELGQIRDNYNKTVSESRQLNDNWPGETSLGALAEMAVPLFIYAATMCRLIAERRVGSPEKQILKILEYKSKSQLSKLEVTYLPVLDQLTEDLDDDDKEDVLDLFRSIVGTIINLATPLSTRALAGLTETDQDDIDNILDSLHSVLSVPLLPQLPVRLLHLSFRDFLVDTKRRTSPFWVDEKAAHQTLVDQCIRVMRTYLHEDLCGLEKPGASRSVASIDSIKVNLPDEVQYSCLYWVHHVQGAEMQLKGDLDNNDNIISFLKDHFLHWLEALSLMERIESGAIMLNTLIEHVEAGTSKESFLSEAREFILAFASGIRVAPLQVYSCYSAFSNGYSVLNRVLGPRSQDSICHFSGRTSNRDLYEIDLEDDSRVYHLVFSNDSKLLAARLQGGDIKILDVATGQCLQTIVREHANSAIAFSGDSKYIAWSSPSGVVQIWDLVKRTSSQVLEPPVAASFNSRGADYLAWSYNSKYLASDGCWHPSSKEQAPDEFVIHLWEFPSGKYCKTLTKSLSEIHSIVFSPDAQLLAAGSSDGTMRIWRIPSGDCLHTLPATDPTLSLSFSHDASHLVVASDHGLGIWDATTGCLSQTIKTTAESAVFLQNQDRILTIYDGTVEAWDTRTGQCLQNYRLIAHGLVSSCTVSPSSELLATSTIGDAAKVSIWKTSETFSQDHPVSTHHGEYITWVSISPDCLKAVSLSRDGEVKLWSTARGECLGSIRGTKGATPFYSATFSHDSSKIAFASYDSAVHMWDPAAGNSSDVRKITGGLGRVLLIQFSPDSSQIITISMIPSRKEILKVFDCDSGDCVQTINVGYRVAWVSFSRDAKQAITASFDGDAFIWDIETGELLENLGEDGILPLLVYNAAGQVSSKSRAHSPVEGSWHLVNQELEVHEGELSDKWFEVRRERLTSQIHTDIGSFDLQLHSNEAADPDKRFWVEAHWCRYGLSHDRRWVMKGEEKLLHLPARYDDAKAASRGPVVILGCVSGHVSIIKFNDK